MTWNQRSFIPGVSARRNDEAVSLPRPLRDYFASLVVTHATGVVQSNTIIIPVNNSLYRVPGSDKGARQSQLSFIGVSARRNDEAVSIPGSLETTLLVVIHKALGASPFKAVIVPVSIIIIVPLGRVT